MMVKIQDQKTFIENLRKDKNVSNLLISLDLSEDRTQSYWHVSETVLRFTYKGEYNCALKASKKCELYWNGESSFDYSDLRDFLKDNGVSNDEELEQAFKDGMKVYTNCTYAIIITKNDNPKNFIGLPLNSANPFHWDIEEIRTAIEWGF